MTKTSNQGGGGGGPALSTRTSRAKRKSPGNAAGAMHMEQQSFREFISGLSTSDRDSRS